MKNDLFCMNETPAPKQVAGFILVQEGESLAQAIAAHDEPYSTFAEALADKRKVESRQDKLNRTKHHIYELVIKEAKL